MARISKGPITTFKENIKVARGFVKLQYYINDLMTTGGDESVGKLLEFTDQLLESLGVGFTSMGEIITGQLQSEVETGLISRGEEGMKQFVGSVRETLSPSLEKAVETIEEVKAAVERGLLQQSLVIAVSALEVYLHDVTEEAVSRYRYIEQRFTAQLSERFDYGHLRQAEHDVRKAVGKAVAGSYNLYDSKSVRRHLRILLNRKPYLETQADLKRFHSIVAHRNLVAHRAGRIDNVFKKEIGHKGRVGSIVDISQKLVEDALIFVEDIATDVQEGLEKQRAEG
jgi:hypothetical protein